MSDIDPVRRTKTIARRLRDNQTDCERILWSRLRWFKNSGYHFRRQVALGPFVVDFLCKEAHVIVEADGDQHAQGSQLAHDLARDAWLRNKGFVVLRYANHQIRRDLDGVCEGILAALKERLSFSGLVADTRNAEFERHRIGDLNARFAPMTQAKPTETK